MEAKDMMADLLFRRKYLELLPTERMRLDEAYEISFKAGIKEVVDYFFYEAGLVRLMGCMTMAGCISLLPNWQAKLKEWGIKEDQ